MPGVELPRESTAIVDTSVLYAMGGPSNDKYQAFEEYVTRRDVAVRIGDHVAEELGEGPEAYRYQCDRLRSAQDAGWATSVSQNASPGDCAAAGPKNRTRTTSASATPRIGSARTSRVLIEGDASVEVSVFSVIGCWSRPRSSRRQTGHCTRDAREDGSRRAGRRVPPHARRPPTGSGR
jgi:hypothetical protein